MLELHDRLSAVSSGVIIAACARCVDLPLGLALCPCSSPQIMWACHWRLALSPNPEMTDNVGIASKPHSSNKLLLVQLVLHGGKTPDMCV